MLVLLLLLESSLLCISFLNIPQFYHKQKKVQNHHIIFSNYGTKDPSIDLFISTSNTNTNLNNFSMDRTKVVDNNDDGLLNFDEEPSSMDYNTKMKLVKSIIDTDTSLLEELVPILVQKEDDIKILIKALSGCRSNSDWRTAFSLYQYSKKLLMMGMFSEQKKENYNYATSVITSSAKIERIPPVIYGQCLVALARGGAEVQAYQVLCEMLESGVAPNLVTMDNIILELSSRGAYKVIIEMIEQLTRFRSETAVSNVALNALLNACNRVEAYDSIVYSYQRFIAVERESNHIVLDKIGFSVLLKACDRIEDAIYATKAALKEGIVPGGGIALFNAAEKIKPSNEGEEVLLKSIIAPMATILVNAGISIDIGVPEEEGVGINVVNGEYVNMVEEGIIDPVLVTKTALKNAVSVVTTIISADCVISNIRVNESS